MMFARDFDTPKKQAQNRPTSSRRCARALAKCCVVGALFWSAPLHAQSYQPGGFVEIATGFAGGGPKPILFDRARTTLHFGGDLRTDPTSMDGVSAGAIVEIEPHASFGATLHYLRWVTPHIWLGIGAEAILAPNTLVGVSALANFEIPFDNKFGLLFGPQFVVFFGGSDLPSQDPIWQLMLRGGIRVNF
jgi:hypothetical protein